MHIPDASHLRAFAQLARLPAGFTAVSNILAAQFIATGGSLSWPRTLLLVLASVAIYFAGMVLNDCFDFADDARERPARPLPAGRVSRDTAWIMGWGLLAAGLGFAAVAGGQATWLAGLLALLVVAYDGGLKRTLLGPVAMAGCRYVNWLLGLSVAAIGGGALLLALPIGLYIAAVTTLGRQETGKPAPAGVALAAVGVAAATGSLILLWWQGTLPAPWLPPLAAAAGGYLVWRHLRIIRGGHAAEVRALMTLMILGVIPLDALMVLGAGLPLQALAVLALLIPARLLARVMYVT